jgi:NAD(P)-dependent dehydrogenase (short-subunit alcohol dehydrogenase family)
MEPDVKTNQLPHRVAIVTGGGRELGPAMVLGLANAGMHVFATAARERAEVDDVAEEVRQRCGESRVIPIVADVTKEDDCAAVVDAAASHPMVRRRRRSSRRRSSGRRISRAPVSP